LKLRNPRPESVKFVTDFARKTGDLQVLSKPDIHLLALTYDLEIERNGGDWRLRREPDQKRVNGPAPGAEETKDEVSASGNQEAAPAQEKVESENPAPEEEKQDATEQVTQPDESIEKTADSLSAQVQDLSLQESPRTQSGKVSSGEEAKEKEEEEATEEEEEDDGGGEWISSCTIITLAVVLSNANTLPAPSNIKKYQARENAVVEEQPVQKVLQSALLTADMAMRNVALRMNLKYVFFCPFSLAHIHSNKPSLLDSGFARITYLRTWVLRCHGCFKVCKDTSKQFCPSCGQATLTRVSCSTDVNGNFTLHLKKNFQYIKRGNVYSIPKPTHGSANGKVKGGGKNGWGNELILAPDQKEYLRKLEEQRRMKAKDLMDEDYLPSILGGARSSSSGRIRVGPGRNVNAAKKRR
jgi:RNA-binding protein NOB1